MPAVNTFTYKDYSSESSVVSVESTALTAANFDAQETLRAALETAMETILIGVLQKTSKGNRTDESADLPASSAAQRENKFLVSYHDDTFPTRKLSIELPCPDVENEDYFLGNTDLIDLEDTDIAAFVTAFEAFVLAPWTGNAVSVDKITLVGRKL